MKRTLSMTALSAFLVIGAGCHHNESSATTASASQSSNTAQASTAAAAADVSPEQLGALGAEIKKHPNDARKLITDHGMTEESFAAAIRKVSEHPADAKRYAAAFKQAS